MPKTKGSFHDQLATLREQAAAERVAARDIEINLDQAERTAERARDQVIESMADDDQAAVAEAREAGSHATAQAEELRERLVASGVRTLSAQRALDVFLQGSSAALLEERGPAIREVAAEMTRAAHELIQRHRAYVSMRAEVDTLVAATPGAMPRTDGPVSAHAWEAELRALERAVRATAEVEPPLPRWAGRVAQRENDRVAEALQAQRTGLVEAG